MLLMLKSLLTARQDSIVILNESSAPRKNGAWLANGVPGQQSLQRHIYTCAPVDSSHSLDACRVAATFCKMQLQVVHGTQESE